MLDTYGQGRGVFPLCGGGVRLCQVIPVPVVPMVPVALFPTLPTAMTLLAALNSVKDSLCIGDPQKLNGVQTLPCHTRVMPD